MRSKTGKLICAALGAGVLSLILRLRLYHVGFDQKHILSSSHPLHLICLALAGIMAAVLALALRDPEEDTGNSNSPVSQSLRPFILVAAGCMTDIYGLSLFRDADAPLAYLRAVLSLAAAGSMILIALISKQKLGLHSLFHGIITLFFALDMLCRYRDWSGNPQLPDYVLQIFACLLLSLCSYHLLAFDAGLGKRRFLLWCSLMAMYLSLACVSGPDTEIFYLGGTFWAAACICSADPPENSLPETPAESDIPKPENSAPC